MEGDVLMSNMGILAVATGVLGGVFALLRWFATRLLADIERRLARIEDISHDVTRIDGDLKRLVAELPLHYQRRDDAIREYTVINIKLDRLYELVLRGTQK